MDQSVRAELAGNQLLKTHTDSGKPSSETEFVCLKIYKLIFTKGNFDEKRR